MDLAMLAHSLEFSRSLTKKISISFFKTEFVTTSFVHRICTISPKLNKAKKLLKICHKVVQIGDSVKNSESKILNQITNLALSLYIKKVVIFVSVTFKVHFRKHHVNVNNKML